MEPSIESPSYDYSNQSSMIIGKSQQSIINNSSDENAMITEGINPIDKNNDLETSEPFSKDKSEPQEYSLSQFHHSMQCIIKCVNQVKQSTQMESQFVEQKFDLLDNDMSSINMVPPSLVASYSLEAFLDISITSPIHFRAAYEQLRESHQKHLSEEKELQELRQKLDTMSLEKDKLDKDNRDLKQKLLDMTMKYNKQKNDKDLLKKKYSQCKQQASYYKSKLNLILTYDDGK